VGAGVGGDEDADVADRRAATDEDRAGGGAGDDADHLGNLFMNISFWKFPSAAAVATAGLATFRRWVGWTLGFWIRGLGFGV